MEVLPGLLGFELGWVHWYEDFFGICFIVALTLGESKAILDKEGSGIWIPARLGVIAISKKVEQDAAPQIRPRWWVGGLTGGGSVVEVVKAR